MGSCEHNNEPMGSIRGREFIDQFLKKVPDTCSYVIFTTSMEKKMAAHAGAPGSFSTTSGYVRKTRPGPLFTTSDTSAPCSRAMWPRMENVTQPASKQVSVFTTHVMRASLGADSYMQHCVMYCC